MIEPFEGVAPRIAPTAFVADSARVIGDVGLGAAASVWFGAVVRGDINRIEIGARSNVQDVSVLHVTRDHPVRLGEEVTLGHRVVVHGAEVRSGTLVGIGAIVLDGAEVGEECLIAAGAVVTPRSRIPDRSFVAGIPARVVRPVTAEELARLREPARSYLGLGERYRKEHGR